MKLIERTVAGGLRGATLASMAFLGTISIAQPPPGGLGPPLYVGRPDYFSGGRPQAVMGQPVPSNAVGYTMLPGGGLRWEYGGGGGFPIGPALPSVGIPMGPPPGFSRVETFPFPQSQPLNMPREVRPGDATYFNGVKYSAVNGQSVPKDAIGYRFDGASGRVTWVYAKGDTAVASSGTTTGPGTSPTTLPEKPATIDFSARRRDLLKISERIEALGELPAAVKARRADALASLASTYAEIPAAPASLDADDVDTKKAVDRWVSENDVDKMRRLRALYLLAKPATVKVIQDRDALWLGRCAYPAALDREDAATLALFVEASSATARATFSPKAYDLKTQEFVSGKSFDFVDKYDSTEAGVVMSKLFEGRGGWSKLEDVAETAGTESEISLQDGAASTFGIPYKVRLRTLTLGTKPAIAARLSIGDESGKSQKPIGYCLFTKKWNR